MFYEAFFNLSYNDKKNKNKYYTHREMVSEQIASYDVLLLRVHTFFCSKKNIIFLLSFFCIDVFNENKLDILFW